MLRQLLGFPRYVLGGYQSESIPVTTKTSEVDRPPTVGIAPTEYFGEIGTNGKERKWLGNGIVDLGWLVCEITAPRRRRN